jgi:hypothetical protein
MRAATVAVLAAALAIVIGAPARAQLVNFGGSFQVIGTNAPNDFSETDALALGNTAIDGGALTLTVTNSVTTGGDEWVVFDVQTTSGGPIAGDLNADWGMQFNNIPLLNLAMITQLYLDWGTAGTLVSPTNNLGGNLGIETNPLTGSGLVFGGPFPLALTSSFDLNGFADPFAGFLTPNGFNPGALTEFQIGVELVPEPVSLVLLGTGLAGLGLLRRNRARARPSEFGAA